MPPHRNALRLWEARQQERSLTAERDRLLDLLHRVERRLVDVNRQIEAYVAEREAEDTVGK